jgi:hypothetical protein
MIAVLTDNAPLFRRALAMFEERLPAYVYHHSDGSAPVPAPRNGRTEWCVANVLQLVSVL